ncbi:hypothetical protein BG004_007943, partial [Podila humilis]
MGRERAAMPPANASDLSEVQLEAFTEGELLESDMRYHPERWEAGSSHSQYSSSSSSRQLRQARARCSSSTLFDDARSPSEMGQRSSSQVFLHDPQTQYSYQHSKHDNHSPVMHSYQLQQPPNGSNHQYYRGTFDPSMKKHSIHFQDARPRMETYRSSSPPHHRHNPPAHHHQNHHHQSHHYQQQTRDQDFYTKDPQDPVLRQNTDTVSMTSYGGDSPSWSTGARLKIESSTP